MDVEVREPAPLRMPLVIDFGSTNTTAGVYLDSLYFENAKGAPFAERFVKNAIQYTVFGDKSFWNKNFCFTGQDACICLTLHLNWFSVTIMI